MLDFSNANDTNPIFYRAYESGTTQTARRLDGGTLRQRRPNTEQHARTRETLPFGTADANAQDQEDDDDPEMHADDASKDKEFKEVRDIGRSVFHVYFDFSGDNCQDELEPTLLKKVAGTMAWLPVLVKGLSIPHCMTSVVLFIEASFRGIAQVSEFWSVQYKCFSSMITNVLLFYRSFSRIIH